LRAILLKAKTLKFLEPGKGCSGFATLRHFAKAREELLSFTGEGSKFVYDCQPASSMQFPTPCRTD